MPVTSASSSDGAGRLWPWILLAWLAVCAFHIAGEASLLHVRLGDSDDAMRLVEVRDFLAGKGWYDMHIDRLQPPEGYVSHWSRLIDAGLAVVFLTARLFTSPTSAEWIMRLVWPLLWLLPCMAGVVFIAVRLYGRQAAWVALGFSAVAIAAQVQFVAGRIDHHNVQIALSVMALTAAVWQDHRFAPAAGGILCGAIMAIGLEALPFAILVAAAFALPAVFEGNAWQRAGRFGGWLAVSSLTALAVSLPPSQWFSPMCDQIAINTAGAAALGGGGLWLASRIDALGRTAARRLVAGALAGIAAAIFFAAIEPACLAGPFALVDPAIRPIWLNLVGEAHSLPASMAQNAAASLGALAFPLAALVLGGLMFTRVRDRLAIIIMMAAVAVGVALMWDMIRTYSYAAWFAIPLAAAGVVGLWERLPAAARPWQKAVPVVLCSPLVLTLLAVIAANAVKPAAPQAERASRDDACLASASFKPIAALTEGLIAAPINLGAHLLALTPHEVLAAPFHRLSRGILISHGIFASPPDEAHKLARDNSVKWIVFCAKYKPGDVSKNDLSASLWQALKDGHPPTWLTEAPSTAAGPLYAYRVDN